LGELVEVIRTLEERASGKAHRANHGSTNLDVLTMMQVLFPTGTKHYPDICRIGCRARGAAKVPLPSALR